MAKVAPSLEELITYLRKTRLPTVVVEGNDDHHYYRRIEQDLIDFSVDILPVSGRETALNLLKRRKEFGHNNVLFILDQDFWLIAGIPEHFLHRKIIFTDGYSVENDAYRDGDLEILLTVEERKIFERDLTAMLEWQSYCNSRYSCDPKFKLVHHPSFVLEKGGRISTIAADSIGFTSLDPDHYAIISDYKRFLRGKTLVEILLRQLARKERFARYSDKQLLDIAAAQKGTLLVRMRDEIQRFFSIS